MYNVRFNNKHKFNANASRNAINMNKGANNTLFIG